MRNFAALGSLAMVCDADPTARQLAIQLAPDARVVSNLEDVLNSSVTGVAIATPAETHYELGRQALEAGKDTFVEKPLALNLDEGERLVRLAEKRGRILMVGHVLEYHPAIEKLLGLVADGELGDLRYVYSDRVSLGKIRREENILWSFAPHDIAVILRLIGDTPVQVVACGGSYLHPDIADVTVTHLQFRDGVRAHIHVSWLHPFKEQRLVLIGSRKMATFDDVAKSLILYDQRVEIGEDGPVPVSGGGEILSFREDEPLRVECDAFLQAVETREPPLTDGHSGLRVLEVLEAAQRSLIANGNPVRLTPGNIGRTSERVSE